MNPLFSFFDRNTLEACDLNALLIKIKDRLLALFPFVFPVIRPLTGEVHCYDYVDFYLLFDADDSKSAVEKSDLVLQNLTTLFRISHCLQDYSRIYAERKSKTPQLADIVPALQYHDFDSRKATVVYDYTMETIMPIYTDFQRLIQTYLHHLLFLETNASLAANLFSHAAKPHTILSEAVIHALTNQGILSKLQPADLEAKLKSRHAIIAATLPVAMDCSP